MGCDIYLNKDKAHEMWVRDSYSDPNIGHFGLSWSQDVHPRLGKIPSRMYKGQLIQPRPKDRHPYWLSPKNVQWFRDRLAQAEYQKTPKKCWESYAGAELVASFTGEDVEDMVTDQPEQQMSRERWRAKLLELLDAAIKQRAYVYVSW